MPFLISNTARHERSTLRRNGRERVSIDNARPVNGECWCHYLQECRRSLIHEANHQTLHILRHHGDHERVVLMTFHIGITQGRWPAINQ